jgi:hypothetical protein
VIPAAGAVDVDIEEFAAHAVPFAAVGALLGALFGFVAEFAGGASMDCVDHVESVGASAVCVDVGDDGSGFGLVELVGELEVAGLADAEVAEVVVVDSVVADCGADAADVADVVECGCALELEGVADGAAFLRAGRDAAAHAVEGRADAAVGAAEFLLGA